MLLADIQPREDPQDCYNLHEGMSAMKKFALVLAAAVPLIAGAGSAAAQKIVAGQWTGVVTEPDGDRTDVVYDVTVKGDTIEIIARPGGRGNFPFSDVKLVDAKTLTFWFTPGPRVDCKLTRRDDGAFEGPCLNPAGQEARLLMVPPKDG
jgi:hypothetical protein